MREMHRTEKTDSPVLSLQSVRLRARDRRRPCVTAPALGYTHYAYFGRTGVCQSPSPKSMEYLKRDSPLIFRHMFLYPGLRCCPEYREVRRLLAD